MRAFIMKLNSERDGEKPYLGDGVAHALEAEKNDGAWPRRRCVAPAFALLTLSTCNNGPSRQRTNDVCIRVLRWEVSLTSREGRRGMQMPRKGLKM